MTTNRPPQEGKNQQLTLEQAIAIALENHNAGNFQQAEIIYKQILTVLPEHIDAAHNLGILYLQLGRNDLALPLLEKTLELRPDFAEAHFNISLALSNMNRGQEALIHAQQAIRFKPNYPEGEDNLGNVHQVLGDWETAKKHYQQALALNPRFFQAYNNLGNVFKVQQDFDQAVEHYQQALVINPDYVDALNNLGLTLIESGRPEDAIKQFDIALALSPDNAHIYNNLGVAFAAVPDFKRAAAQYARALELHSDYAQAHLNLGLALAELEHPAEALQHFQQCVNLAPDSAEGHLSLGQAQLALGLTVDAENSYRTALTLQPENPQAQNSLGNLLKACGHLEAAATHYRQAIALKPDYAEAHRHLADTSRHPGYSDDIRAMETLFADQGIDDRQRMHVAFGLGKAFEDLEQFDKAFEYLRVANRLRRESFEFSIAAEITFLEQLENAFDARWASVEPEDYNPGCTPDCTPVFILGMPRSGTSLIEQILASHSQVYGAGELSHLWTLCRNAVAVDAFPEGLAQLENSELRNLGAEYVSRICQHNSKSNIITDKAPINFLFIGMIQRILPQAKIIHCQRDPMDTCFSIYKKFFSGDHPYAYDLGEIGAFYRAYQKLMNHWESIYADRFLSINYEELVADPEPAIRGLLSYCQLSVEPACLRPHQNTRAVHTASATQVRRPIYKSSVRLWQRYENHLDELKSALGIL